MAKSGKERLTQEGITTALRLCRAGLPDCQIAAVLGVRADTYSRWINHPKTENQTQLSQALKKADAEREAAGIKIDAVSPKLLPDYRRQK